MTWLLKEMRNQSHAEDRSQYRPITAEGRNRGETSSPGRVKMTRHQRAKKAEHRALLFLAITLVQLLAFKFLLRVQELCGNKIGDF